MSGVLFDSNVLLDIATADKTWLAWSQGQLQTASSVGPILINPLIYAEIAPAFASQSDLDRWLDPTLFHLIALPFGAAWLAAEAFIKYRRSHGTRTSPLPDFYIGAHAQFSQLTLVTRDLSRYQTYFPNITLITP